MQQNNQEEEPVDSVKIMAQIIIYIVSFAVLFFIFTKSDDISMEQSSTTNGTITQHTSTTRTIFGEQRCTTTYSSLTGEASTRCD